MSISPEEVSRIAKLARLNFTEGEKQKLQTELSAILDYVDQLKQVKNISTEVHDQEALNLMRDDVPEEFFDQESLISQAPARAENFVKVKSILE